MTYQEVYLMDNLSIESKAIYGMLCSYAGMGATAYPSVDFMCDKLRISKSRFYKHVNLLVGAGVIKRKQIKKENNFSTNVYTLVPNLRNVNLPHTQNEHTGNEYTECEHARNKDTNNNTINNNTNNNNTNRDREYINYQQIADMYNDTCVSFPRVTKLSDFRKKAIKARLKQYSVEDLQRLFTMAEESSFLKGKNDRNWSANFDWLIKDANMAKVLDGNYIDNSAGTRSHTITEEERARLEAERIANMPDWMKYLQNREPREDDPFK